jgi:glucose-6-phosphate-specific signal transduction histidine kinase
MTNNDVLEFSHAIAGGTVWTNDLVTRAAARIRGWFAARDRNLEENHQERSPLSYQTHTRLRILDESQVTAPGQHPLNAASQSLEEALSCLRSELAHSSTRVFRLFVTGKSRILKPEIQEQVYQMGREALVNALRHSGATTIEAEIVYLPRRLRIVVTDNGCGIDPEVVRSAHGGHCGLWGMHERAANIGATVRIWSKPACGTVVEICIAGEMAEVCA